MGEECAARSYIVVREFSFRIALESVIQFFFHVITGIKNCVVLNVDDIPT